MKFDPHLYLEQIADRIETEHEQRFEDIDVDYDKIQMERKDGKIFLINYHNVMQQIWYSSPISGGSHYSYDDIKDDWIDTRDGQSFEKRLWQELQTLREPNS